MGGKGIEKGEKTILPKLARTLSKIYLKADDRKSRQRKGAQLNWHLWPFPCLAWRPRKWHTEESLRIPQTEREVLRKLFFGKGESH